jgi:hypothetical protein
MLYLFRTVTHAKPQQEQRCAVAEAVRQKHMPVFFLSIEKKNRWNKKTVMVFAHVPARHSAATF